jgi:hypothetical protein
MFNMTYLREVRSIFKTITEGVSLDWFVNYEFMSSSNLFCTVDAWKSTPLSTHTLIITIKLDKKYP